MALGNRNTTSQNKMMTVRSIGSISNDSKPPEGLMIKVSHQDMQVIRQLNNSNTITSIKNMSSEVINRNRLQELDHIDDVNRSNLVTGNNFEKLIDNDISHDDASNQNQFTKQEIYEQFKNQNINRD